MNVISGIYLLIIISTMSIQNITKKLYANDSSDGGTFLFSAISVLFAVVFFLVSSKGLEMNLSYIPYSIAFAVSYGSALIFSLISIASGPLWLSSLITSFSLMIPTLYGIVVLNESVSNCMIVGFVLLIISLFLVNKKSETKKISAKWIVSTILAFAGNGFCSVTQNMQQVKFDGMYKNEFMICALLMVLVLFASITAVKEKKEIKHLAKKGCIWGGICGIANGAANLFVMIALGSVPSSVLYPVISAGGIAATCSVSVLIFKEKLSCLEFIGFILGTASIVFLNL